MTLKFYFILLSLLLSFGLINAQSGDIDEKKGTLKIRKPAFEKKANINLLKKTKNRIYTFRFRSRASDYQIVFPKDYNADLFPLVFNNRGLVITDADKNITDNVPYTYDYDLFRGNIFVFKKKSMEGFFFGMMLGEMGGAGSYAWISHVSFKDKNGILHVNEIPEFKVERLN